MKSALFIQLFLFMLLALNGQKLVPYNKMRPEDLVENYKDSVVSVKYFANKDTLDRTAYIKITKGNYKRMLKITNFVNAASCSRSRMAFYDDSIVVFIYSCVCSKDMYVVNMKSPIRDKRLEPYFVNYKDSLVMYQMDIAYKRFYVSSFNLIPIKSFVLKDMQDCGNTHDCFIDFFSKEKALTFVYMATNLKGKRTIKLDLSADN